MAQLIFIFSQVIVYMKNFVAVILLFCGFGILTSCVTGKRLNYLSNLKRNSDTTLLYQFSGPGPYTIQKGDLLSIQISSLTTQSLDYISGTSQRERAQAGTQYRVKSDGRVELLLIGDIYLDGLTFEQAEEKIRKATKGYLQSSVVQVDLLNFNVTVLGDVRSPGKYSIPDPPVNILQVVALAGDLNLSADRERVNIIRISGNRKDIYKIDLTDKLLVYSPAFYIQSNDIIYVETRSPSSFRALETLQMTTTVLSTVLLIFNVYQLFNR